MFDNSFPVEWQASRNVLGPSSAWKAGLVWRPAQRSQNASHMPECFRSAYLSRFWSDFLWIAFIRWLFFPFREVLEAPAVPSWTQVVRSVHVWQCLSTFHSRYSWQFKVHSPNYAVESEVQRPKFKCHLACSALGWVADVMLLNNILS